MLQVTIFIHVRVMRTKATGDGGSSFFNLHLRHLLTPGPHNIQTTLEYIRTYWIPALLIQNIDNLRPLLHATS